MEGHELDTFRGAEGILTQDRPLLLFECEARHNPGRAPYANNFVFEPLWCPVADAPCPRLAETLW